MKVSIDTENKNLIYQYIMKWLVFLFLVFFFIFVLFCLCLSDSVDLRSMLNVNMFPFDENGSDQLKR